MIVVGGIVLYQTQPHWEFVGENVDMSTAGLAFKEFYGN